MTTRAASKGWLWGPVPDLLLGCGVLYLVWFVAASFAGPEIRSVWPFYLTSLLLLVFSMPHYGGTLLRVYEQRADRRGYVVFSLWATLAVIAAFAIALRDPYVGAWMFTIYLTWSPWHYTGQNYGLASMFLGRRGVEVSPLAKRLLYTSFILSFALTFTIMHAPQQHYQYDALALTGYAIHFLPIGIPDGIRNVAVPLLIAAYGASLVGWIALLLRRARVVDLVPALALSVTQAVWFAIPMIVDHYQMKTGIEPLDAYFPIRKYFLVIAVAHGVQYLWVTSYFAHQSDSWRGLSNYFAKVFVAGTAAWYLPPILFSPDALGAIPADAGLTILTASAVNIHHFILDGAIWKLRSTRISRVLIRSGTDTAGPGPTGRTPLLSRRAVWAVAAFGSLVGIFTFVVVNFELRPAIAAGDPERTARWLDRMAWIGADSATRRVAVGGFALQAGDRDAAIRQYERSLALRPSADAWRGIASARGGAGDFPGAIAALDAALEFEPDHLETLQQNVQGRLTLGDSEGARELMLAAVERRPESLDFQVWTALVCHQIGDPACAVEHLRAASALSPGSDYVARNLAWILATTPDAAIRDPQEAKSLAEARLAENSDDPGLLDALAAAYAAGGQFEQASEVAQRAIEASESAGDRERSAEIRGRLELYRNGRAYVERVD